MFVIAFDRHSSRLSIELYRFSFLFTTLIAHVIMMALESICPTLS